MEFPLVVGGLPGRLELDPSFKPDENVLNFKPLAKDHVEYDDEEDT